MNAAEIHAALGAAGWRAVLLQIMDASYLRDVHGPCPGCGGKDRFRFDNRRGRGDFYCNGCGAGDGFELFARVVGLSFAEAKQRVMELAGISGDGAAGGRASPAVKAPDRVVEPPRHAGLSDYARELWAATSPVAGEARAYLEARGVAIPPCDSDLRWHPALRHPPQGFSGPALVALVRDVRTGEPMTIHRTWIAPDGSKRGDPPRLLLKGHSKVGGAVMLWPSEAVTTGLAVAEGIETALAVALAYTPVWSVVDAGNLARLPVLAGIESLLIAADGDDAGERAALACGQRWADAGKSVSVIRPGTGRDVADVTRVA